MKNVCDGCRWQKKRLGGEWNCLKYGIPMKYGRTYCVAAEGAKEREKNNPDPRVSNSVFPGDKHA